MAQNDFWDDNERAQEVITESNELRSWFVPYEELLSCYNNVKDLFPEAFACQDEEFIQELLKETDLIEHDLVSLEVKRMLSGELDKHNCFISINAGAGGTEACDWVEMLARMYRRWAQQHQWGVDDIDSVPGEVAGFKSVTIKINGDFSYGYAKAERGVHRLVRISPFDSGKRRHTSFASVDVTPEVSDKITIDIKPDDIRVDTFRSSGAGGQHVNVTDSAVRITHLSTGFVVSCQNERSQIQNRETCMKMLRSKLYAQEVMEREKALKAMSGEKMDIAWGSQIRNYVFQPYSLVKDTRTKVEDGDVQAVMDGDIDQFINSYLKEYG